MNLSQDFAEKSVQAAVAAIEVYNKPDFRFREEAFCLLMTSAWEHQLETGRSAGDPAAWEREREALRRRLEKLSARLAELLSA